MFHTLDLPNFRLTIADLEHDLQVVAFEGHEAISAPYSFDIELVSEQRNMNLENLLNRQAFLTFDKQGSGVHGLIYRLAQGDSGKRLTHYKIRLVPRLAYLEHRTNQRVFQQTSVPQIITLIFKEHGILSDAHRFQLNARYPPREYCVQYHESDLHFIQRLCHEEGLHYHFQHNDSGHLLVLGDDQTVFPGLNTALLINTTAAWFTTNRLSIVLACDWRPEPAASRVVTTISRSRRSYWRAVASLTSEKSGRTWKPMIIQATLPRKNAASY